MALLEQMLHQLLQDGVRLGLKGGGQHAAKVAGKGQAIGICLGEVPAD